MKIDAIKTVIEQIFDEFKQKYKDYESSYFIPESSETRTIYVFGIYDGDLHILEIEILTSISGTILTIGRILYDELDEKEEKLSKEIFNNFINKLLEHLPELNDVIKVRHDAVDMEAYIFID